MNDCLKYIFMTKKNVKKYPRGFILINLITYNDLKIEKIYMALEIRKVIIVESIIRNLNFSKKAKEILIIVFLFFFLFIISIAQLIILSQKNAQINMIRP